MILRSEIKNKYSQIPNSVIRDKVLMDSAYRLLIYLYSLPDGWKINQDWLGKELGCSRININKKIRQIKEKGYLLIHKSKTDEADYIYELIEPSMSPSDVSVSGVSLADVSLSDVSVSDTHINTNISNTDLINTELIKLEIDKEKIKTNSKQNQNGINYEKIIDRLNELAGTNFKTTSKETKSLIDARINGGFKEADLLIVVEKMCYLWNKEPKANEKDMRPYLRPSTLFQASKFENYLNMRVEKRKTFSNPFMEDLMEDLYE